MSFFLRTNCLIKHYVYSFILIKIFRQKKGCTIRFIDNLQTEFIDTFWKSFDIKILNACKTYIASVAMEFHGKRIIQCDQWTVCCARFEKKYFQCNDPPVTQDQKVENFLIHFLDLIKVYRKVAVSKK